MLSLSWLAVLTALSAIPTIPAETVHSVVIFTRHGDRTAKYYKGYRLTNLGADQVYSSGQFYRDRYIEKGASSQISGISADKVTQSQIWASAPDQLVLYNTATSFLQGLYPPLSDLNQTAAADKLTNGTSTEAPLDGYQFILVHGEGETDPDTIWIKGDDECPVYETASKAYRKSDQYQSVLSDSAGFYSKFEPILSPIMGAENVSYKQAYDVFDLLNVASIHNASVAPKIDADDLDQLRYYANEWEWNHNFNASNPDRSIGGMALAGGIRRQLKTVVEGGAKQKFNLMAGSYDTFLAFFGLTNLTAASDNFMGIPNYASSMVFELYSQADDAEFPSDPDKDLMVRYLFRNGTEDSEKLDTYPLFGSLDKSMSYGAFMKELGGRAIVSVEDWCTKCASKADFCKSFTVGEASATSDESGSGSGSGSGSKLSNAAAGGIGAGVTLAVIALGGLLFWLVMGRKSRAHSGRAATRPQTEKGTSDTESDSV